MIRILVVVAVLFGPIRSAADVSVRTVDFLEVPGLSVNAAGPVLVQIDVERNRLVAANTLSSSMSVVDCRDHTVKNIPLGGRALQHLKSEAMVIARKSGDVYLIGTSCLYVVDPDRQKSKTIPTEVQYESIAVDEETRNVFVVGRESESLGFLPADSGTLVSKKWVDTREDLINLNATPPPPIRKVIADNSIGRVVAIDGIDPALYLFNGENGELIESRPLPLESGGRWHLAGYDEEDHALFVVVERTDRKVVQAARIDVLGGDDVVVPLPEFTEGVGITFNPRRKEVYIPYDNHPSVHVVEFAGGGTFEEIRLPAYGNDAAAVDLDNDKLYIGSWAHGEVDVVDLKTRTLDKRITGLGIIPHMFTIAFNPNDGLVYFPKGASAVNGTFGAAVTALDPTTERTKKIYTGWAPIDLVEVAERGTFFVFNSEDQFAEVRADGTYDIHTLPYDYPVRSIAGPESKICLSYGPHQSYWPTVYIWDAKNGVLNISLRDRDRDSDLEFYDRRIPRQAHRMVVDRDGVMYFTQNNWGKEEQFLGVLQDPVRVFEANQRIRLGEDVEREITQRILEYDPVAHRLYLVRIGENDTDPSILQVIDPAQKKVLARVELGITATDLVFDDSHIYVANFDSRNVSVVDKVNYTVRERQTGNAPLKMCLVGGEVFVIDHIDNTIQEVGKGGKSYKLPQNTAGVRPNNVFEWRGNAVVTVHGPEAMSVVQFDPRTNKISTLHQLEYPFGNTHFDTRNVSFYVRGQYGDAVFEITQGSVDADGRLWITDFLSGKLFVLE